VIVSRALRRRTGYADTAAPKGKGKCVENLLSTVVTSAVVATIVGAAINAWLEARRSRWNTRLDALRAAITLEGYAVTCADKIADHGNAVSSAGHAGSLMGSVPDFPEVTVAAGFLRPRRASVANRLLVFPQEVRQADQAASFWWTLWVIRTLPRMRRPSMPRAWGSMQTQKCWAEWVVSTETSTAIQGVNPWPPAREP
jgi:hypothetical protein